MGIERRYTVVCDWPGCNYELVTGYKKADLARKAGADRAGFVTIDGLEFCGPPTARNSYQTTPRNHAELMKTGPHRPAITGIRRSFHVACTCTRWDSKTETLFGASTRTDATMRWLWRHIYLDVVKPAMDVPAEQVGPDSAGGVTV